MKRAKFHVVPNQGVWDIKRAGRLERCGLSPKRKAIKAAAWLAKRNEPSQVIVHNRRGVIIEERTYPRSSDPNPPRG